jgi:NAD(P)-dependent dehydrogenase (short-subunit alcohol dehydrogenase family)
VSTQRLAARVALVTGAASGIGAETARTFVAHGARVVIADLQDAPGQALAKELGAAARFAHCDVTQEADVAAAVDLAVAEFGQLDVMVNNAGIVGVVGPIASTSTDAFDATLAVLLRGVFLGMKHAARVMLPRASPASRATSRMRSSTWRATTPATSPRTRWWWTRARPARSRARPSTTPRAS